MLPSLVNQFVSTIKETSLGYIIGLAELSQIATQINTMVFIMPISDLFDFGIDVFSAVLWLVAVGFLSGAPLGNRQKKPRAAQCHKAGLPRATGCI